MMDRFDVTKLDGALPSRLFLEASAGTGKTFTLEGLYLHALKNQLCVEEILIVTFTKAAVAQLRDRICDRLLSMEGSIYLQAYRSMSSAQIFTIHGFCLQMLQTYFFEAVSSPLEMEEHLDQIRLDVLRDYLRTDLTQFGSSQLKVLFSRPDAYRDLANLRVVCAQDCFANFSTLYQQFLAWIETRPGLEIADWISYYRKGSGIEEFLEALETLVKSPSPQGFDAILSMAKAFRHFTPKNRRKKKEWPESLEWLEQKLVPLLCYAIDPYVLEQRVAHALAQRVAQVMETSGVMTPDEILEKMRQALAHESFVDAVRRRYRACFCDEFQDTDAVQWDIFSRLFLHDFTGSFVVVGDPKQSIYRFRQADIYTYLRAAQEFPPQSLFLLDTNYRSHPTLVEGINHLFAIDPFLTLAKTGQTIAYHPLKSGREEPKTAPRIAWCRAESSEQALTSCLEAIEPLDPSTVAIIIKDRYQQRRVEKALSARGIPYSCWKKRDDLEDPSLLEWQLFIHAIEHPEDLERIRALLVSCYFAYPVHLLDAFDYAHAIGVLYHLQEVAHTLGVATACLQFLETALTHQTPREVLSTTAQGRERLERFEMLVEQIKPMKTWRGVENVLSKIYHGLVHLENAPPQAAEQGVTLVTMHTSKGLEFDHVFAMSLAQKMPKVPQRIHHLPGQLASEAYLERSRQLEESQELASEAMRLVYVTLTRAKETLWIPHVEGDTLGDLLYRTRTAPLDPQWIAWDALAHPFATRSAHELTDAPRVAKPLEMPNIQPFPRVEVCSFSSTYHTRHSRDVPICSTLPPGLETGTLVHALLEKQPPQRSQEQTRQALEQAPPPEPFSSHLETLSQILFRAYHTPFLHGTSLHQADRIMRETPFLFFQQHKAWQGVVDVVCCVGHRVYLIDWKTHLLEAYHQDALAQVIHEGNYRHQASLYIQALQKHLDTTQMEIGGFFFVFVRGLLENQGVYEMPMPAQESHGSH